MSRILKVWVGLLAVGASQAHGVSSISGMVPDTGGALSGVTVTHVYPSAFPGLFSTETTTTNGTGDYSFTGITETNSWIFAGQNGYAQEWYSSTMSDVYKKGLPFSNSPPTDAEERRQRSKTHLYQSNTSEQSRRRSGNGDVLSGHQLQRD